MYVYTIVCMYTIVCVAQSVVRLLFYPWVMCILTVRITEAFDLPKPSLFCNVQRDVASLPSYSKLDSKCDS